MAEDSNGSSVEEREGAGGIEGAEGRRDESNENLHKIRAEIEQNKGILELKKSVFF